MFLRSQSRTPRRSPPLQRRPSDTEPLVIASGSGTQNHTGTNSAARTSLMKNLNLNNNNSCHYSDDDGDYDQQQSSSSCPNNMDHKHHNSLLNSNSNKLSHKHSTTSTFDTYSTAPTAPVASSSRVNITNPFENPSHIVEPSPSGSSTPSTIPSDSSSPQPHHPLYRTTNAPSASHPHPLSASGSHGLDGTVTANAGFTAGTTNHGLPIPGVTNKRVHTSTTISSKRSGRSTSSKLSRRVKKFPRAARRAVKRFLRRVTGRSRKKEKMKVTWTAPQV
ncbi:hypothetical protein B0H65DRAFT_433218 [Neurospora tetraspora]|uniref:Uncharacterized protein n=1 Tax=Neurospora tetraspora TaxID=94610 RepID=A0AAE0MPS8_9PEZI|nr:hypothetical protein B0H65DRAFT_433218 [Neurospora tetraspora]